jgi:acetyl/propionyl-CoA carboxylase alpha subunit
MADQYVVKVNEFSFQLSKAIIESADIVKTDPLTYHLIKDFQTVHGRILEVDKTGKKMEIEIDGETLSIELKDELDGMLEKMGYNTVAGKQLKEIKAPMPGLVLQISVKEGQQVSEGDKILILEAMKMENSILIQG